MINHTNKKNRQNPMWLRCACFARHINRLKPLDPQYLPYTTITLLVRARRQLQIGERKKANLTTVH